MKWGRSHSEDADFSGTKWTPHSLSLEEEYSNPHRGTPSINLSTWSERPKQQISIKDDGDYRFGFGKKSIWQNELIKKDHLQSKNSELSKKADNYNTQLLLNKTNAGFKLEEKSKSISDLSRIPIVTAVELKKPYIACSLDRTSSKLNQGLKVNNKNITDHETVVSSDSQNNSDGFIGVNSLARKFGVPNKRPSSVYETGTGRNYLKTVIDNKSDKVNRANTIERNTFSTVKISEAENELRDKMKSVCNQPDSTSVIKALSKIRSGGIVEVEDVPDSFNVNNAKHLQLNFSSKDITSLTPKIENKFNETNSTNNENQFLFNNSKLINNNISKTAVNSGPGRQTHALDRNVRPVNLHPVVKGFTRVSVNPPSKGVLSSPHVEDSKLSCTSLNQDCSVYKNKSTYKTSLSAPTLSSVSLTHIKEPTKENTENTDLNVQQNYFNKGNAKIINNNPMPPPPPQLPILKPIGERKGVKFLPPPAADPRDLLMSSIRSFRRDDLKTLSK